MKKINVYDVEEERVNEICEKHDIDSADLIMALLNGLSDDEIEEIIESNL